MASNSEASCFCLLSPGLLSRTCSDATFTKHTAAAFPWEEVEVWSELDGEPVIGLCCLVLFSLSFIRSSEAQDKDLTGPGVVGQGGSLLCPLLTLFQIDCSKHRCIDESEGRLWAESRGFLYFETSAQTGEGINEMFQVIRRHSRVHVSQRGRSGKVLKRSKTGMGEVEGQRI